MVDERRQLVLPSVRIDEQGRNSEAVKESFSAWNLYSVHFTIYRFWSSLRQGIVGYNRPRDQDWVWGCRRRQIARRDEDG